MFVHRLRRPFGVWVVVGLTLLGLWSHSAPAVAVTPNSPEAKMLALSPAEAVATIHWFGITTPSATSDNQTEQLFAEPEVQVFLQALDKLIVDLIASIDSESGGPPPEFLQQQYSWCKELIQHPGLIYLSQLQVSGAEGGELSDIDAGLVWHLSDRASALRAELEELLTANPEVAIEKVTVGGLECSQWRGPEKPLIVTWTVDDGHFYLTVGPRSMENLLARRWGTAPPAALAESVNQVRISRPWMVGRIDIDAMRKLSFPPMPIEAQRVLEATGLSSVARVDFASGLHGRGSVSRTAVAARSWQGLLSLADQQPLTAQDLATIPQDAQIALAVRVSPTDVFRRIVEIVGAAGPEALQDWQQGLAQFREITRVDLEKDLLASLGDTWTMHQSATVGFIPNIVVSVNVRDEARLREVHEKLLAVAEPLLNQQGGPDAPRMSIGTAELDGQPAYFLEGLPVTPAWQLRDSRLTVATSMPLLGSQLNRKPSDGSLADHPTIKGVLASQNKPLLISFTDSPKTMQAIFQALPIYAGMAMGPLSQQGVSFDVNTIPAWETVQPHLEPTVALLVRTDNGIEYRTYETLPITSMSTTSVPVAVALLLPAVHAAREAARRAQSINNARQLSLAILNFESANKHFPPPALKASNGQPGLSWRVAILPYLEEQQLYDQFHLDEPWDSEHNKKLIAMMPDVFKSPGSGNEVGKTNYLAVRGDRAVIAEGRDGEGVRIADITDGTSNTVWMVEVDDARAVEWTRPDDFEPDAADPSLGLGGLRTGEVFIAAYIDGHVSAIKKSVAADVLRAIFTRNGNEVVEAP